MTAAPEPPSPCTRVCALDPGTGLCRGCFRTLAEIAGWSSYTAEEKREVLRRIEARKARTAGTR
ncbi:MAG TPA: DUF1289 domain-containing protein [Burkholderiales bacterium]